MRRCMGMLLTILLLAATVVAQQGSAAPTLTDPASAPNPSPTVRPVPASMPGAEAYTLPAGTQVPITLKHAISTRTARVNDPVYGETAFPVVAQGHIVIPPGTYVQGVVQSTTRGGHGHKSELVLHFTTLIFPSGYTLLLPGAIENVPGAEQARMKDGQEGTIEAQPTTGKDVGTVAKTAAAGTVIGAAATRGGLAGVGVGGALGAGAGLAAVLLSRPDVRLESGAMVQMVLERDIVVEHNPAVKN